MREHNMGLAHQEAAGAAAKPGREKPKLKLVPRETPKLNPAARGELGKKFSVDLRRSEMNPAQFEAFRLELTTERDRLAGRIDKMKDQAADLRLGIDELEQQIQRFDEQMEGNTGEGSEKLRLMLAETRDALAADLESNEKHQLKLEELHRAAEDQIERFSNPE